MSMITAMYVVLPLIFSAVTLILLALQKVEKANKEWDEKMLKKA